MRERMIWKNFENPILSRKVNRAKATGKVISPSLSVIDRRVDPPFWKSRTRRILLSRFWKLSRLKVRFITPGISCFLMIITFGLIMNLWSWNVFFTTDSERLFRWMELCFYTQYTYLQGRPQSFFLNIFFIEFLGFFLPKF